MNFRDKARLRARELRDSLRDRLYKFKKNPKVFKSLDVPVNIPDILENAKDKNGGKVLSDAEIYEKTSNLRSILYKLYRNIHAPDSLIGKHYVEIYKHAIEGVEFYILLNLSVKKMRDLKITESQMEYIYTQILKQVHSAITEPGDMLGASISYMALQNLMQMALNTFHHTGQSKKTVKDIAPNKVVDSILSNNKSKNPTMFIYPQEKYNTEEGIQYIFNMIENVKIMELIDKAEIIYEKTKSPADTEIKEDKKFIKDYIDIVYNGNFPVVVQSVYIRIVFKKNKIAINNVHLDEVAAALEANFKGVTCIYSSVYKMDSPVLRIYKTLSNEKKDIIPVMKDILHQIKKKDILIRGVPGIDGIITTFEKNVYPNPQTGEMEEKKQHMIVTSGSNLREILHMQRYIDPYRTHSNVVEEMHKELGYEAARKTIFMVLNEKFEEAKGLNSRHIEFITDIMTQNENILSFNRNGFKASNYGPIQKMFFEIPLTVINDSALYSKEDKGQSIESRQFTAKPMRGGTGICDVFYSPDEGKKKEIKEGGARENETVTAEMIDNLF